MIKNRSPRISSLLKLCVLFLSISFLLWNCTNEELVPNFPENSQEPFKSKVVDAKSIPDVTALVKSKFLQQKSQKENQYQIDYSNVLEITDNSKNKSYSFKLKNDTPKDFANIVVFKKLDGTYSSPVIYRYIATEEFYINYKNRIKTIADFTGELEIYSFDNYFTSKSKKKGFGGPCSSFPINNGTPSVNSNPSSYQGGGSYTCIIKRVVKNCRCQDDLVGVHNHQATTVTYTVNCNKDYSQKSSISSPCGGTTSNSNLTPVGVNQPPIIPCLDKEGCEEDIISYVLNNIPNLSAEEIKWISNLKNIATVIKIRDFLKDNNNSSKAELFAKGQIELENETKNIPWKASKGTIGNLKYTHVYHDLAKSKSYYR